MIADEDRQPWERMPGEGEKAFAAFNAYRNTPADARSIPKCVAVYYGKPATVSRVNVWRRWSGRWRWQYRVQAWQDYLERKANEARVAEVKAMAERHAKIGAAIQGKGVERLQKLEVTELTAGDVLRFLSEGIKIERAARGEPSAVVEQRVKRVRTPDELTDEDLLSVITGRGAIILESEDGPTDL